MFYQVSPYTAAFMERYRRAHVGAGYLWLLGVIKNGREATRGTRHAQRRGRR